MDRMNSYGKNVPRTNILANAMFIPVPCNIILIVFICIVLSFRYSCGCCQPGAGDRHGRLWHGFHGGRHTTVWDVWHVVSIQIGWKPDF